ncbi:MAG: lipopolysaccharide heptosyltransferase II [Bacteroidota bacterium]
MTPNRILIVQTAFIGDVILITPLIRGIKELYPKVILDVMVIPQTAGVLNNNPNINDVVLFDKRKNKIVSFFKTLLLLRNRRYDIAITPHSSITTALLLKYAKIKMRIGFDRWSAAKYLTDKVPHPEGVHKTIKILSLLSVFSDKDFSSQTELFPTENMLSKADDLLKGLKANTKKIIAIAPGSVWFTKRWPIEHYKKLTQKLLDNSYGIILIGSEDEKEICAQIESHQYLINLAGSLPLLESAAVIKKCDLIICNDSGALHIANAVQTDIIAFFGPTVQSVGYFPFRENDFVFEREMDCRPCGSHGGNSCHLKHHNCMKLIEPEIVLEKIIERDINQ